jgi:hypothetical protein
MNIGPLLEQFRAIGKPELHVPPRRYAAASSKFQPNPRGLNPITRFLTSLSELGKLHPGKLAEVG